MQTIVYILLVALFFIALWLKSKFGSREVRSYWQALPLRRMKWVLLSLFLSGASISLFVDLYAGGNSSGLRVAVMAMVSGVLFATVFLARVRLSQDHATWIGLVVLVLLAAGFRSLQIPNAGNAAPPSRTRIQTDAFGLLTALAVGAASYRKHIVSEGVRQLRTEAELELAHHLQAVLVPPLKFRDDHLNVCGQSIASEKVGGDLVDFVASNPRKLAYLIDVSGHGIPAGALMGSVKSAVRMMFPCEIPALLESLNRVLPSVKEPHMYATLALLSFDPASREVEYALAGHLPILHYRAVEGVIDRLSCEEFPLGMFSDIAFTSHRIPYTPGDLFVLFSDGITEAENEFAEQFGLDRLCERILAGSSHSPDDLLQELLPATTNGFGHSDDDRSLLLIRVT